MKNMLIDLEKYKKLRYQMSTLIESVEPNATFNDLDIQIIESSLEGTKKIVLSAKSEVGNRIIQALEEKYGN